MQIWIYILAIAPFVHANTLYGRIVNVPQAAFDVAQLGMPAPVMNGLNFQSRFDVQVSEICNSSDARTEKLPVARNYTFEVPALTNGEYELRIHSLDFILRRSRFRIIVSDNEVEVLEDPVGSKAPNGTSRQNVGLGKSLEVEVVDYKEYYERSEGKLREMVMSSPLGFIFRSRVYTALFVASLVIMAFPYILSFIDPEYARELQTMQTSRRDEAQQDSQSKTTESTGSLMQKAAASTAGNSLRERGRRRR